MAIAANLTVALGLESAQYRQGLDRARNQARGFQRNVQGTFASVGRSVRGLTSGVVAFGAALGAQSALQTIDQLIDLQRAVGGNFDEFQRLVFALSQAGLTATQTARALVTISQRTDDLREGTASTVRLFDALGVSLSDLEGLSPEGQFRLVTQALRGIDDAAVRASIAADLFGSRISIALGPVLSDSQANLDALGNSIRTISEEDAQAIELFNDAIENLGRAVVRLLSTFSPVFDVIGRVAIGVSRLIDEFNGIGSVILGFAGGIIINRLRPAFFAAVAGVSAFRASIRTLGASISVTGDQISIAARGQTVFAFNTAFTIGRVIGLRNAFILTNIAIRATAVAAATLRATFAALFAPVNLIITAVTIIIQLFGDQLVQAFRVAVNFIVRQINALIRGLDRLIQFFGGDGIDFQFEEWNNTLEQTATMLDEVGTAAGNAAISFEGFNDTVDGDAMAGVERLNDSFQQVGNTIQTSLRDTLVDAFRTGEVSARSFLDTVSNQILQVFASRITNSIIGNAFTPGTASLFGQILGFNRGGVVPRIPGSRSGVDSVPALLTPGETVTPAGEVPGGITVNFNVTGDVSSQTIRVIEENSLMVANIVEQTLEDRGRL